MFVLFTVSRQPVKPVMNRKAMLKMAVLRGDIPKGGSSHQLILLNAECIMLRLASIT
jgi:hypothetical protein